MLWLWLLDGLDWFLGEFNTLSAQPFGGTFPSWPWSVNFSFDIPVVGMGGGYLSQLDAWFAFTLVVLMAIAIGRAVQWLYRLIPFNG